MVKNEKSGDLLLGKYEKCMQDKIGDRTGQIWYRGQESATFPLWSGAVQRIATGGPDIPHNLVCYHNYLIITAECMGWNQDFGRGKLNDLTLLATLQHHGVATGLLDFTENFYVALWFACQEVTNQENNRDGKVFGVPINPGGKRVDFLGVHSDELVETMDYFLDPEKIRNEETLAAGRIQNFAVDSRKQDRKLKFWYWQPESMTGRKNNQVSRFIFGPNDFSQLDNELYKQLCHEIKIKQEDKVLLLEELRHQHGFWPETIYADWDGFGGAKGCGIPHRTNRENDPRWDSINPEILFDLACERFEPIFPPKSDFCGAAFYWREAARFFELQGNHIKLAIAKDWVRRAEMGIELQCGLQLACPP